MSSGNGAIQQFLGSIDWDLENYSFQDLCKLFFIHDCRLTETSMKSAKSVVHQMHPDKSRLPPNVFQFYNSAYKRLVMCSEFQNKFSETNKKSVNETYDLTSDQMQAISKHFGAGQHFDRAKFNEAFDTTYIRTNAEGYGDWLKSDEGLYKPTQVVTKGNMDALIEDQRKKVHERSIIRYTGPQEITSQGGTSIIDAPCNENGYSSTEIFGRGALVFQDLKIAHENSVIPVTREMQDAVPKYNNVEEYERARAAAGNVIITAGEHEKMLLKKHNKEDSDNAALAFKLAKQIEDQAKNTQTFWSKLLTITN